MHVWNVAVFRRINWTIWQELIQIQASTAASNIFWTDDVKDSSNLSQNIFRSFLFFFRRLIQKLFRQSMDKGVFFFSPLLQSLSRLCGEWNSLWHYLFVTSLTGHKREHSSHWAHCNKHRSLRFSHLEIISSSVLRSIFYEMLVPKTFFLQYCRVLTADALESAFGLKHCSQDWLQRNFSPRSLKIWRRRTFLWVSIF